MKELILAQMQWVMLLVQMEKEGSKGGLAEF